MRQVDARTSHVVEVAELDRDLPSALEALEPLVDLALGDEHGAERVEGMPLGLVGPHGPGDGHRLGRDLGRLGEGTVEHQDLGVAGEHPGPLGRRRLGRDELEGPHVVGQAVLVGGPEEPAQALVHQPGGHRIDLGIDELEGQAHVRDRAAELPDQVLLFGGMGQHLHVVEGRQPVGVGHGLPQLERPLEVTNRFRRRRHPLGGQPGLDRRDESSGHVAGPVPVVRDRRGGDGPAGGLVGELLGDLGMDPPALAGQQLGVDDLLEQGVAEAVALAVGRSLEQVVVDQSPKALVELAVGSIVDAAQQAIVDPHPDRGGQPQRLLVAVGQVRDPTHEDVAQGARQALGPLGGRREQLLGEQRVSLAAAIQRLEHVVVGCRTRDGLDLVGQLPSGEGRQVDPHRGARPDQLGEHRPQRVPPVQLVAAQRREQHDRTAEVALQEHQQVERRPVGPVQVLDHEEHRGRRREVLEEAEQQLEQPTGRDRLGLGRGVVGQRGRAPGPPARERWCPAARAAGRCRPGRAGGAGPRRPERGARPPHRARRSRRTAPRSRVTRRPRPPTRAAGSCRCRPRRRRSPSSPLPGWPG